MLDLRITGGPLIALLFLGSAGCLEGLNKPAPPPVPAEVTALQSPTGSLSEVPFSAVLGELRSHSAIYASLCGWDPSVDLSCLTDDTCPHCTLSDVLFDVLADLLPSLTGEPDAGIDNVAGVNGYVDIVRICPGFGEPSPDPAHGSINATVGFTGYGVDPIIWGTVSACQLALLGQELTLEADFGFHYEERVPFALVLSTPVIFTLRGTVTEGASVLEITLAVRTRPDGTGDTEILVDLGGLGTFALIVGPTGIFVKAADGYFACNVMTETCQAL